VALPGAALMPPVTQKVIECLNGRACGRLWRNST
jgi:hypothetical protein